MFSLDKDILTVELPTGCTMSELNTMAKAELATMTLSFFGKDIKVMGHCTTALAMLLGHELGHICRSVSIFDPKENEYVLCGKILT